MRGTMIALGATLIAQYHWILYVFGAFLIVTGIKMLALKTAHTDPNQNIIVRLTGGSSRSPRGSTAALRRSGWSAGLVPERVPWDSRPPDEAVDQARPGTWMLTPWPWP